MLPRVLVSLLLSFVATAMCQGEVRPQQRLPATGSKSVDTVVICPIEFQPSLGRWLEWRRQQGHRMAVVSPAPIAAGIRQQIAGFAEGGNLQNVVLVGDVCDPQALQHQLVATDFVSAKVNVQFGSSPEIATDSSYADLNADGLPDVAIGRIPVDSAEELIRFTDRIIEYESQPINSLNDGLWRRRINFVAGVGGFGKLVDSVVQQTTKQLITDLIPAEYQTTMTFGSWSSPYCPDPRRFSQTALDRFNEGCLFWVYVGHGHQEGLDYVRLPDQHHPILDTSRVPQMDCRDGSPIAIFLACYTGATDHHRECLAETMLRQPHGPIAVICGTRVTMPYAMSLLSMEMMDEYFAGDSETLGELMRLAKCRLVQPELDRKRAASQSYSLYRTMIEGMGKSLSPRPELLEDEKREHVKLVHLIGDPLLRVKRPNRMELKSDAWAMAGDEVTVSGVAEYDGELLIELVYDRDRFRHRPGRRRNYLATDAAFNEYQLTYQKAQQRLCSQKVVSVSKGAFEVSVHVPPDASGRCQVRATLANEKSFAMGASPVRIVKETGSSVSGVDVNKQQ